MSDKSSSPTTTIETELLKCVFLTGATGFLGAFLLDQLLQQTQAKIYCLVRAKDEPACKERLWNGLQKYQLSSRTVFDDRVVALPGDLAQSRFGLDKRMWLDIGHKIDSIIHNGCLVNFMCPYQKLKGPNVDAIAEIIRLATMQGQANVTPIHYISSLSVYGSDTNCRIEEADELPPATVMEAQGGYTQTKWIGEKMLVMARSRGVPVSIHRPGRILGDSMKGTCNNSDFMFLMLKGCAQLGYFPNIAWTEVCSPVDYVSAAIVFIARKPVSRSALTPESNYNLVHPQRMAYCDLFEWMVQLGYTMKACSFDDWKKRLEETEGRENAMYALLPVVAESGEDGDTMPEFKCSQALAMLKGSSIECPEMNRQMLAHYLSHIDGIEAGRKKERG